MEAQGEKKRSTMSVAGLILSALVLLVLFPASVVARTGPTGRPTTETISYLEQTPGLAGPAPAKLEALPETAEVKAHTTESMDHQLRIAPQDADSIFHFHSNDGSGSSSSRRGLVGSSPPTCRAKCGTCNPCKPVHIAIGSPHGVISETEYYPEVWRCQCGNRYYMP